MRVAVAGALAQRAGKGGHAWVFLQYLLGFRRLGCEVRFVDRLEHGMSFDRQGRACRPHESENVEYLMRVMSTFGLQGSTAVLVDGGRETIGMDYEALLRWMQGADLLVDVMGYLDEKELLEAPARRLFLDIDPGFVQMWCEQNLYDPLGRHDSYATIGANIGRPGCSIPTCDVRWIPTRPPVVLQEWPVEKAGGGRVTTVATWRGPYAPVEFAGESYGLRAHQLCPLAELPRRTSFSLEMALDIEPDDRADADRLRDNGWILVDPAAVADSPESYRAYIGGSAAELMVPKAIYARTRSGWFSDRSACYLATGRPVVAGDTGLGELYPVEGGLLLFETLDEAADRLRQLSDSYPEQSEAARSVAEEYFDSDRVLEQLLADVGAG